MKEIRKTKNKIKVLNENPYDLEIFFESLSIASENEKELLYIDLLIKQLRSNPDLDLTVASFEILEKLGIITMNYIIKEKEN